MAAPRVLWVVPVAELGGVARHVLDVARVGLPAHHLTVLCPEGPLAEQLRAQGSAVLTGAFGPRAARTPWAAAAASSATLRHAIRTLRPAVVHSHLAYADVIAAAVVKAPRVPGRGRGAGSPLLVSTEHGISGDSTHYHSSAVRARAAAAVHRRRLRATDVRLAVAQATASAMGERWDARRVTVIPNGVDRAPAAHGGPADGGLRVLSLARLAPEKGLHHVLDAFAAFRVHHPTATLTLAGDGPERDGLGTQIRSLGLCHAVSMPGHVPAPAALARHHVLVQLSRWENCSYTLLDAAAAGLGVVATRVGGNPEILPAACLVAAGEDGVAATVAQRMAEQCAPENRPGLPASWPTVAEMTARIAATYERRGS